MRRSIQLDRLLESVLDTLPMKYDPMDDELCREILIDEIDDLSVSSFKWNYSSIEPLERVTMIDT